MKRDPYMDDIMRTAITSMARKHYRRIAGCDVEDLVQEGFLCYYRCKAKYVNKPPTLRPNGTPRRFLPRAHPDNTAKRHLQALVQRAMFNRIETMAKKQKARYERPVEDLGLGLPVGSDLDQFWERVMPPEQEITTLSLLCSQLPLESAQAVTMLMKDAITGFKRVGRWRETTKERLARAFDLPPSVKLEDHLRKYFLS